MPFLGDRFRAAREARGLSLADVSEQLHIRAVYLDSIEREDWAVIGAPVYTRGFIRAYARFLGLDAEGAVAEYGDASGHGSTSTPGPIAHEPAVSSTVSIPPQVKPPRVRASTQPAPPSRRSTPPVQRVAAGGPDRTGPSTALVAVVVVALLLVGAVAYTLFDSQRHGSPGGAPVAGTVTAAPIVAAATPPPPRPVPPPAASRTLALAVNAKSWVRVAIDGGPAVEGMLEPGTTKVFHGRSAVVRVGNAGGVSVSVNGKSLGALGANGAVVERTFQLARE